MIAKLRSWWKDKAKPLEIVGIVAILIIAVVLVYIVVHFYGTGFDGYEQISVAHTIGTITKTEVLQPGKTLWDWLQLLIIPVVLTVGGFVFNLTVSRNERAAADNQAQAERAAADKRDQTEREIASDNQCEAALQQYIDKMSELLLDKNLRESQQNSEVRKIARVRTLTVLPRLDADRKRSILLFLYESSLIGKNELIIDLNSADLSNARMNRAHLSDASLSGANLSDANLRFANLNDANLSDANLSGANLRFSKLIHADLRRAKLIRADLNAVKLNGADLNATSFFHAELSHANLTNAKMSHAHLNDANLSYANLTDADLSHTYLSETNLNGANLNGANLSGATISTKQLHSARSLTNTTMPDGSIHP